MTERIYRVPPLEELNGNKLLIASVNNLVINFFKINSPGVNNRNINSGQEIDDKKFIKLLNISCENSLRFLRAIKDGGNRGDPEWDSGSSFSQAYKQLFLYCLDQRHMTDPEIWQLFDAIFSTQAILLGSFGKFGYGREVANSYSSAVTGLTSELSAYLYLKQHQDYEVVFSDPKLDTENGVDIVLSSKEGAPKKVGFGQFKTGHSGCKFALFLFRSYSDFENRFSEENTIQQRLPNPKGVYRSLQKLMNYVEARKEEDPQTNFFGFLLIVPPRIYKK